MKRALVTGASGFIGRQAILPLQERGFELHVVCRKACPVQSPGVIEHHGDLLDHDRMAEIVAAVKPTHLLHFAWHVDPTDYRVSVNNLSWVRASIELLEVFRSHGGTRVVMAGTCMEYDWRYGYCTENLTPLCDSPLYSACKGALGTILGAFGRETGISSAWGRIFFAYGPHEHPMRLVASVVRSLLRGEPALCTSGEQVRDFLHVADIGAAFAALLDSDVVGPVNIGSGIPVALKDIVEAIAAKIGRPDLLRLGALQSDPSEARLVVADIRRLSQEVKWSPTWSLSEGLDHTIEWHRREDAAAM
ncbi:MAG: NAD(P)-dependent oxidoreductase [Thermodesulfobacteriota bacterium]